MGDDGDIGVQAIDTEQYRKENRRILIGIGILMLGYILSRMVV